MIRWRTLLLLLFFVSNALFTAHSQDSRQEISEAAGVSVLAVPAQNAGAEVADDTAVPELSVRTLFHPEDKVDFFGPSPPATKWLEDSILAIESGKKWELLNPETGKRTEWKWPEELRLELRKVPGFAGSVLDAAAARAVDQAENLDKPMMVSIGRALAVIGGVVEPTLVTRDARGWDTPAISPDGAAVAFVQDHDLFVVKVASGEVLRLTQSGSEKRLNGRLDWTYQEEIYGRGNFKGFWWSPDSRHIAYLSIDTSNVLDFTLTTSDSPRGGTIVTAYPKAGDPIPTAELLVVDTETLQSTTIHRPVGDEAESLVVRVTWRPDGKRVTYQIQNRVQTWLELRQSDITGTDAKTLLREEGPADHHKFRSTRDIFHHFPTNPHPEVESRKLAKERHPRS